jgi:hypothetical protein
MLMKWKLRAKFSNFEVVFMKEVHLLAFDSSQKFPNSQTEPNTCELSNWVSKT